MVRTASDASSGRNTIPVWLVLLVVGLLFAVVGVGEFVVRSVRTGSTISPESVAITTAEEAVRQRPDDLDARLSLGYAYQEAARYAEALEEYDRVIAGDPGMLAARYNRGVVLLELGRADEAEVELAALLADEPTHVMAAKTLGERYVEDERYAEALDLLAPAVTSAPNYADVQYLAGYAAEQLGRDNVAVSYYRGALTYAPDMPEAREGLARLGETEVGE